MFPDGLPGAGLLLLRAAAGAALLVQGGTYFGDWRDLSLLTCAIALLTVLSGAALLIGYLTPFAGVLALLFTMGNAFSWFPGPHVGCSSRQPSERRRPREHDPHPIRLFGRREIIIPSSPSPKS